jgi:hypothetical protein
MSTSDIIMSFYESTNKKDLILSNELNKKGCFMITNWKQKIWIYVIQQIIKNKNLRLYKQILNVYLTNSWPLDNLINNPKLLSYWKYLIFKKFPDLQYDFTNYHHKDDKWLKKVKCNISPNVYIKNNQRIMKILKQKNLYNAFNACLACKNYPKSFKEHYKYLQQNCTKEQINFINDTCLVYDKY